jgi:hypothetical protein
MREIGVVINVQIQQASLKRGDKSRQIYDPAPLLRVARLRLSPQGVIGVRDAGEDIVDVHNGLHPQSKNGGDNGISVGFSSHYAAMRDRFGLHMRDGIAGENILVETSQRMMLEDLGQRLYFQRADSGELVTLAQLRAALPCEPFSRFALDQAPPVAPEIMKATLQFLSDGMRGFYGTAQSGMIRSGDRVFID